MERCSFFTLKTLSDSSGQHRSKEFFQINSLQKVPVLKDGDFILTERCPPSLSPPTSGAHVTLAVPTVGPPIPHGAARGKERDLGRRYSLGCAWVEQGLTEHVPAPLIFGVI